MGHLGPRLEISWKIMRSHIRKKTIYTYLPRCPPLPPSPMTLPSQVGAKTTGPDGRRKGRAELHPPISAQCSCVHTWKQLPTPPPDPYSLWPEHHPSCHPAPRKSTEAWALPFLLHQALSMPFQPGLTARLPGFLPGSDGPLPSLGPAPRQRGTALHAWGGCRRGLGKEG